MSSKTRIAIVEDNASARIHLRSHLLSLGNLDISSYSNGNELKAALRTQSVDVVLFDYHLGQHKNGVEWVKSLQKSGLLKPSTGILFITSDQTPQTIGHIVDLQPDFLIIKPYTIRSMKQTVSQYLAIRKATAAALHALDAGDHKSALQNVDSLLSKQQFARIRIHLLKLKARILLLLKRYDDAMTLYESVLTRSENVIWARWGAIKCLFMSGDWQQCQTAIGDLLELKLTQNKAYEWLACIAFEEHNFEKAERWLDNIKTSELTMQATRLKTLTYQMQERIDDAIALLERKRMSNLSVKEHRDELTFELADCHIRHAATVDEEERSENLYKARCLIGNAGRHAGDRQAHQRRDYMLSFANILEGDTERAKRLLNNDWMHDFSRSEANTMVIAAQVWHGVGDEQRAQQILELCAAKSEQLDDQIEHMMIETQIIAGEKAIGVAEDKALALNSEGTEAFVAGNNLLALEKFAEAYRLANHIPAFALNLLQSMVRQKISNYRGTHTVSLLEDLESMELSETNQIRLNDIRAAINQTLARFQVEPFEPSTESSSTPA
ncbi:response regulator [Alteromonas sp. ASW11-36]|uniref:Response regulator n=1 Tax=Alteromonas arenosi TaxID=3055817 RepID=A0ABT7SXV9_9ALTE|nr:response regulator [Alteromonas sp. ASW11-36]MDM7861028.1 response regulator [Alteromonas sp. ASW11-36]